MTKGDPKKNNSIMSTTTEIITLPPSIAARGIDQALFSALKNSIFPGAKDESVALAWDYCAARKLDIMKKPCHIVGMSVKNAQTNNYEWRDVIMPAISELRITANRTGEYAGQDAPIFGDMVDLKIGKSTHRVPEFCTVVVYRMIQGQRLGTPHTEYFEEACGTTKEGELNSMWTKRKRGQLAKCAEAGALRKAFPEESGGIITADEVEGDEMRDVTPRPSATVAKRETPLIPGSQAEPATGEAQASSEPEKSEKPAAIPPTGRQTKERLQRMATLTGIAERSAKGKTWWAVGLKIGSTDVEMTTFSESMQRSLVECEKGSKLWITFTKSEKGYALEDYVLQVEEEGGLV